MLNEKKDTGAPELGEDSMLPNKEEPDFRNFQKLPNKGKPEI